MKNPFFRKTTPCEMTPFFHGTFRYRGDTNEYYSCTLGFNLLVYFIFEFYISLKSLPLKPELKVNNRSKQQKG